MTSTVEEILKMADSTRAALERVISERKRLEEEETVLQEELSAFTKTVKAIERRDGKVHPDLVSSPPSGLNEPPAKPLAPSERAESKATIARRILREGNGLAPVELYNKLIESGVSVGRNYIHSMLFKFKNDGLVRERRGRYYWNEAVREDLSNESSGKNRTPGADTPGDPNRKEERTCAIQSTVPPEGT